MMKEIKTERFKFFSHKTCEFFPCHDIKEGEPFNCLFCYCPLYALKDKCGGNFLYTEDGIKDCSKCKLPHAKGGYDYIMKKYSEIKEMTKMK